MAEWNGRTALITGASSGIGLAFAQSLARQGANLILTARSLDRLEQAAATIRDHAPRPDHKKITIHLIAADLAAPDGAATIFAEIREAGLNVDLLVNNAGFGLTGAFSSQPLDRQLEMIQVNVVSLVALARLFLPLMIARRDGAIINVASTAAFQGVPWLALYAGTKALVLNFSEGLAAECASSGVRVMAFCPGPTESNFHQTAGALPRGGERSMLPASVVVEYALHRLERGAVVAIPGLRNRLTVLFERFVPRQLVTRLAAKVYGPQ